MAHSFDPITFRPHAHTQTIDLYMLSQHFRRMYLYAPVIIQTPFKPYNMTFGTVGHIAVKTLHINKYIEHSVQKLP